MRICAFALIATIAAATPATAQDDFEAALAASNSALRSITVNAVSKGFVRTMAFQQAPALPGTIPARWQALKRYPFLEKMTQDALEEDVSAGRLDPAALMRQMTGDLPVPPGAVPAGCRRSAEFLLFTFGEDLSLAYARLYAERRRTDPGELSDRAFIDAKATRERVTRFLLARGFRQTTAQGRAGFINEARRIRIDLFDSSAHEQTVCGFEPGDLKLPTGPILQISHSSGLQLNESWKDGGVSRMTD